MLPQQAAGLAVEGDDEAVFVGGEDDAVFLDEHHAGMLIAETAVGGPQLARRLAVGGIADDAVLHGLGVEALAVLRQSDALAHLTLIGAPQLTAGVEVEGRHGALGVAEEHATVGGHGPTAGGRVVHVVFLRRLPRPQQFAAALVEAVERVGPVAEQHLAVGDERARLDVALDAVGLPDDGAVAHADGAEPVVAATHVGYAAVDGHRTHVGCCGLDAPPLPSVLCVDAVDTAVS